MPDQAILAVTIVLALAYAYGNGLNDAANALATARARLERNELQLLDASARDVLYYGALRDGEGVLRLRVGGPRLELEVAASDWEVWLALAGLAIGSMKG